VSAVTFPAYEATEIYARSKEALESARSALENARQQRAAEVETSKKQIDNSLLLLKEQTKTLTLK
jgi:phage head maturation protease